MLFSTRVLGPLLALHVTFALLIGFGFHMSAYLHHRG
ncbi:hypothetical protein CaCOL14_012500 [Colletotrichum acutatum]